MTPSPLCAMRLIVRETSPDNLGEMRCLRHLELSDLLDTANIPNEVGHEDKTVNMLHCLSTLKSVSALDRIVNALGRMYPENPLIPMLLDRV